MPNFDVLDAALDAACNSVDLHRMAISETYSISQFRRDDLLVEDYNEPATNSVQRTIYAICADRREDARAAILTAAAQSDDLDFKEDRPHLERAADLALTDPALAKSIVANVRLRNIGTAEYPINQKMREVFRAEFLKKLGIKRPR